MNLRRLVRREGLILAILLALGFLILPAIIFLTGQKTLGAYGEDGSVFAFYRDLYWRIASGDIAAWVMLCSPYVVISICRLLVLPIRSSHRRSAAEEPPASS